MEYSHTITFEVKDLETAKKVKQLIEKEAYKILEKIWKEDGTDGNISIWNCDCDCGCFKPNDRENEQCDDCDNGTHYDDINKVYVNYDDERLSD